MKTRSFQWGRWLTVVVLLAVALAAHAQLSQRIKGKNFTFLEYYEPEAGVKSQTNRIKNLLRGAEGQSLTADLILIRQMRIENYPQAGPGTNLVAQAPEAWFDKEASVVASTGRLDLVTSGGQIVMRGESGFLFSMETSALIVSNRVRTVIHNAGLKGMKP